MEMNRINELPLHIHDEKNGLDYTLHGDYYLPDIEVDPSQPIRKYGISQQRYLQAHRSIIYIQLLFSGKLYDDLRNIDEEVERLLDTMLSQMAKDTGITEALKTFDPMKWVGMMNTN